MLRPPFFILTSPSGLLYYIGTEKHTKEIKMRIFSCKIDMENEAFENHEELPRILRAIAAEITKGNTGKRVADINGNFVGQWVIEEDDEQ